MGTVTRPEQKIISRAVDGGIVQTPVPCDYSIPAPPAGHTLDPSKVNVLLHPSTSDAGPVPNVISQSECSARGGWYYDNDAAPTEVLLCPTTCAAVTTSFGMAVELEFGCATIVN